VGLILTGRILVGLILIAGTLVGLILIGGTLVGLILIGGILVGLRGGAGPIGPERKFSRSVVQGCLHGDVLGPPLHGMCPSSAGRCTQEVAVMRTTWLCAQRAACMRASCLPRLARV